MRTMRTETHAFSIPANIGPDHPIMEEHRITLEVDGHQITILCTSFRVIRSVSTNYMDHRREDLQATQACAWVEMNKRGG
jgi:NADH:ubiquinone oxidoreductase subunit D